MTYDTRSGLPSNTVASLLEARDGTMWFGTPDGLTALSPRGWRTYTTADGLPSNDVNTLFEDRAGTLWVGTAKGVALVQGGASSPRGPARRSCGARSSASRTMAGAGSGSTRPTRSCASIARRWRAMPLQPRRRAPLRHRRWAARRGHGQAAPHRRPGRTGTNLVRAHARAVDGRSGPRRWPRPSGGDARRAIDRRRRISGHARSDSPVVQPPPDRGRLRGPEPGGARAGAFPLPAGRVRSRVERPRRRAPGGLYQPGAWALSVPRDRFQQRRCLERRRGVDRLRDRSR